MAEFNLDISKLPDDVRDKLAELDLELSEGEYIKKNNTSLIYPYLSGHVFYLPSRQNSLDDIVFTKSLNVLFEI